MPRPILIFWRFRAFICIMTFLIIVVIYDILCIRCCLFLLFLITIGIHCIIFDYRDDVFVFILFIPFFPISLSVLFFLSFFRDFRVFKMLKIQYFWFLWLKFWIIKSKVFCWQALFFSSIGGMEALKAAVICLMDIETWS